MQSVGVRLRAWSPCCYSGHDSHLPAPLTPLPCLSSFNHHVHHSLQLPALATQQQGAPPGLSPHPLPGRGASARAPFSTAQPSFLSPPLTAPRAPPQARLPLSTWPHLPLQEHTHWTPCLPPTQPFFLCPPPNLPPPLAPAPSRPRCHVPAFPQWPFPQPGTSSLSCVTPNPLLALS